MKEDVLSVVQETVILGKKIQMYGSIENPLFKATDVADWIDYSVSNVSKMLKNIDDEDKTIRKFCTSGSNYQSEAWFVTEDGLYECCFQSKKPIAKQMKREIKAYLKQIRLTGGYIPVGENDSDSLIMAKALKIADATIKHKDEIIAQKDKLLEEQRPMVENYKILMDVTGTFSMNDVGKYVGIGEYTLFGILRNIGILFYNDNKDNVPYENTVNKSKFRVVPAIAPDGTAHSVTRVLPNGIDYICKQLKKYGYLDLV